MQFVLRPSEATQICLELPPPVVNGEVYFGVGAGTYVYDGGVYFGDGAGTNVYDGGVYFGTGIVPIPGPLQFVLLPYCEQRVVPLGPEQFVLLPYCEQRVVPLESEQLKLLPYCEQRVVPLDPEQFKLLPYCEQFVVSACAEAAVPMGTPIATAAKKERVPATKIIEKIAATNFFFIWHASFLGFKPSMMGSTGGDFYSFLADLVRPSGLPCEHPAPSSLVRLLVSTDDVGGRKGKERSEK